MVSIINRTEEDQTKIIDKDAKNKFKWSWLEKFVTVEIEKIITQDYVGRLYCSSSRIEAEE